jgi:hypothetical protein
MKLALATAPQRSMVRTECAKRFTMVRGQSERRFRRCARVSTWRLLERTVGVQKGQPAVPRHKEATPDASQLRSLVERLTHFERLAGAGC